jgi:hypothetical protein
MPFEVFSLQGKVVAGWLEEKGMREFSRAGSQTRCCLVMFNQNETFSVHIKKINQICK